MNFNLHGTLPSPNSLEVSFAHLCLSTWSTGLVDQVDSGCISFHLQPGSLKTPVLSTAAVAITRALPRVSARHTADRQTKRMSLHLLLELYLLFDYILIHF